MTSARILSFLLSLLVLAVSSVVLGAAVGVAPLAVGVALVALGAVAPAGALLAVPGPLMAVPSEARATYHKIKGMIEADNPKAFATRASLRLEAVGAQRNRYRFNVLTDEGGQRPSERRLSRSDAFFVDRIGAFYGFRASGAPFGSCTIETNPYTSDAITQANDPASLAAMMNAGVLSIEVDQVKYLQSWDVMQSRLIGVAQTQTLLATGGGPLASDYQRDAVLAPMVPTIRLNGGSTNVIEWSVNETVDLTNVAPPAELVLILVLDGWLAANAAAFNPERRP